eukprot:TRINITY_DN6059_c0_g1_i3.p1 TRINITY_DN6059_c0_g1~~TRINITY_DN6059_c0_g1_i3.p1  ORF type:complete len:157 (+),score=47.05 TRINITY_DN6059_c0_g1_i3:60-473(+)
MPKVEPQNEKEVKPQEEEEDDEEWEYVDDNDDDVLASDEEWEYEEEERLDEQYKPGTFIYEMTHILDPGVSPYILRIVNFSFVAILLVVLSLFFGELDRMHIWVMLSLTIVLYLILQWFLSELGAAAQSSSSSKKEE